MNSSRLLEMAELLIDAESRFGIQKQLNDLNSAITNLAGQPANPDFQTNYANILASFNRAVAEMINSFEPSQKSLIKEMNGEAFFIPEISTQIASWNSENSMTPAVTQQKIASFLGERKSYISVITQLRDNLRKIGVSKHSLEDGQAEVGILLPRDLFHNQLDQLVKELGTINRIIRAISEAATGAPEPIEVRQISTTDPLFFFGLNPVTVAAIGAAVTWALATWKSVEEIRKLRAETTKLGAFTDEKIESFFGGTINETIEKAIESKVAEVLGPVGDAAGRKQEQKIDLHWALESILARVERGMTVEIRFLPPPPTTESEKDSDPARAKAYQSIQEVVPQLVFPKTEGRPIMKLPTAEPPKPPKQGGQQRGAN